MVLMQTEFDYNLVIHINLFKDYDYQNKDWPAIEI